MATEIEAQFEVDGPLALAQLPPALESLGAYVAEAERVFCTDHYLDSADFHLRAAGFALRVRDFGGRKMIGLKELRRPTAGLAKRGEWEQILDSDSFAIDTVLDGRLAPLLQGQKILTLFQIHQERVQHLVVLEDHFRLQASRDAVRIEGAAGSSRAWIAELELIEGAEDRLRELCAALGESLGWNRATLSKFERGLAAAGLAH